MLSVDTDEKEVFTVDFVWSSLHRSNFLKKSSTRQLSFQESSHFG